MTLPCMRPTRGLSPSRRAAPGYPIDPQAHHLTECPATGPANLLLSEKNGISRGFSAHPNKDDVPAYRRARLRPPSKAPNFHVPKKPFSAVISIKSNATDKMKVGRGTGHNRPPGAELVNRLLLPADQLDNPASPFRPGKHPAERTPSHAAGRSTVRTQKPAPIL